MAMKFFYVCAGLFLLAASFQLGVRSAGAQAPSNPIVAVSGSWAFTANGDVYQGSGPENMVIWTRVANVFAGSPVPVSQSSWGSLKLKAR